MSGGPSSLKRKRPESNPTDSLTEHERLVYNVIRSKESMGIFQADMRREVSLPPNLVTKVLKLLQNKNLIKEVKSIQNRGKKHFISAEFEPSEEHTGGAWYVDGSLDTEFINFLKKTCGKVIAVQKVCTLEDIVDHLKRSRVSNVELSKQQIEEIVKALVLDNEVMEVKSTGTGEFASVPTGKVCYKFMPKGSVSGEPKIGAFASIPCGVCPHISICTPDGIVSPITCVYYNKWLEF